MKVERMPKIDPWKPWMAEEECLGVNSQTVWKLCSAKHHGYIYPTSKEDRLQVWSGRYLCAFLDPVCEWRRVSEPLPSFRLTIDAVIGMISSGLKTSP
jgi:hypothetical protein